MATAVFITIAASALLFTGYGAAQGANMLQNPGFESTYLPFNGDAKQLLAPGWTPWNKAAPPGSPTYMNNAPDYRASTARVHEGQAAQEFFTFYATHDGGLYQQVKVGVGAQVRFSVWVSVWSTLYDDPSRSEIPGGVKVQIGIDPNGGTDGAAASGIVWSTAEEFYDQFKALTVDATAQADTVTVFVRSTVSQPVKHSNVFVDDGSLVVTGGPTPLPPSQTALPTATTTPAPPLAPTAAAPTNTPIPIAASVTPPFRPSPTREGTIPPTLSGPTNTPLPIFVTFTPGPSPTPSATPVVSPTPISSEFPFTFRYVVKAGDTLSDLAQKYDSDVDAIVSVNGITDVGLIYVGQVLDLPTRTPVYAATVTPYPSATPQPVTGGGGPTGLIGPTNNGIGTYIVQPGEDLAKIAALYHTTPLALARLNGIVNPSLVFVGQILVVPGPGNNVGGKPPVTPARTHVVQPGENLYRISLKYGVTMDALMRANGLLNPNLIYVGQTLQIP
jgi:LysM repeat protein